MLAQLQQVEKDLLQFNSQQIKDRLPLIEVNFCIFLVWYEFKCYEIRLGRYGIP
jgi:hypothetical protein